MAERYELLRREAATLDQRLRVYEGCMQTFNDKARVAQVSVLERRASLKDQAELLRRLALVCFVLTIAFGVVATQAPVSAGIKDLLAFLLWRTLVVGILLNLFSRGWMRMWDQPDVISY